MVTGSEICLMEDEDGRSQIENLILQNLDSETNQATEALKGPICAD
jgi:hypothetical protein